MPESVKAIEINAFRECEKLQRVTFADGSALVELEESVFHSCKSLKTVSLPPNLQTIGEFCFQESGLIELIIPKSVKKIEQYAFSKCPDLKKVTLPEGLEVIPETCFWQSGLEEIKIPENVKVIETAAF